MCDSDGFCEVRRQRAAELHKSRLSCCKNSIAVLMFVLLLFDPCDVVSDVCRLSHAQVVGGGGWSAAVHCDV